MLKRLLFSLMEEDSRLDAVHTFNMNDTWNPDYDEKKERSLRENRNQKLLREAKVEFVAAEVKIRSMDRSININRRQTVVILASIGDKLHRGVQLLSITNLKDIFEKSRDLQVQAQNIIAKVLGQEMSEKEILTQFTPTLRHLLRLIQQIELKIEETNEIRGLKQDLKAA
jgi:hypothetical protein